MAKSVEDVLFEMIGICESLGVDYAVLGEIAVRVHGIPRPTFDVDIEVSVTPVQLNQLFDDPVNGYKNQEPRTGFLTKHEAPAQRKRRTNHSA